MAPAHEEAGLTIARNVRSLDAQGRPDDEGTIVLLPIGVSRTTQEFSASKPLADPDECPKLVIVDGAQAGMATTSAAIPESPHGLPPIRAEYNAQRQRPLPALNGARAFPGIGRGGGSRSRAG